MGVHTGEAKLVGSDYVGLAVHQAARIGAAGHGGQVLLSGTTADLLPHDAPERRWLKDFGPHRLKDIATPVRLYQLTPSDLRSDFPPLRTLGGPRHNLSAQLTSFVGREEELGAVAESLNTTRVVTLTGVGGVGKTRLALEIAARVLPRFRDGVWLVELAAITDPDSLPHVVAVALGIQRHQGLTISESIVEALRDRELLLVLDNCEHLLVASAQFVERVVRASPGVVVLATSREGLGVEGEHTRTVRSLDVAEIGAPVSELCDATAVRLFCDRALAARDDFALTPENGPAVAEICRRLDGVPLALELAAAQVRSMAPQEIGSRLDERFRLLTGGRRTAVERHQTLRAAVDWSYALLSESERVLFERLSVFAGGFTLEAVERVCVAAPVDEFDIAPLLSSVVDKSIVVATTTGDGARYSLLETMRQYAREHLDRRGTADDVRHRHAKSFASLVNRAEQGLQGPDEARWVEVLYAELDNLRVAHRCLLDAGELDLDFPLLATLLQFALDRGVTEVEAWAEEAIGTPGAEHRRWFAFLIARYAETLARRGELSKGRELAERALEASPDPDDRVRAVALLALGDVARFEGKSEEALRHDEEARRRLLAGRGGASPGLPAVLEAIRSLTLAYAGENGPALDLAETAYRMAEQSAHPSSMAFCAYVLGEALQQQDPARALVMTERAMTLARSVRHRFWLGVALVSFASLQSRHGDPAQALHAFTEAIRYWWETGLWTQQWTTLRNLVEHFAAVGQLEPAATIYGATDAAEGAPPLFGPHGRRFMDVVRTLEKRMGADPFAAAQTRGATMPRADVVSFALAEIDRALADITIAAVISD